MTLRTLVDSLHLDVVCGNEKLDQKVSGGYAGDLLSDVIAHSNAGNVWVTMQAHVNIVAVAALKDLAGIVIVRGKRPADDTLARAKEQKVALLLSELPAFETIGRIHALLGNGP
jgi:hypothetical protein